MSLLLIIFYDNFSNTILLYRMYMAIYVYNTDGMYPMSDQGHNKVEFCNIT